MEEECAAGVNVRELVGGSDVGWLVRTPCNPKHSSKIQCEHFETPTQEEFDAWLEKIRINAGQTLVAIAAIKEIHGKERGVSGQIDCPACGSPLNYAIADINGNTTGRCTKEGCTVAWIE